MSGTNETAHACLGNRLCIALRNGNKEEERTGNNRMQYGKSSNLACMESATYVEAHKVSMG